MPIDIQKLSPLDFCIVVTWIQGKTTGQIFRILGKKSGKTEAAIRGVINKKINAKRAVMTTQERQKILDDLKANRIDEMRLPDELFIAEPVKSPIGKNCGVGPLSAYRKPKPKPVEEAPPGPMTRTEKRNAKKVKRLADEKRARELEMEQTMREQGGNSVRGLYATPLEMMSATGMLADPNSVRKGSVAKSTEELRRTDAGLMFRTVLEESQLGGLKSQNFDATGGGSGGLGMAIPARIFEARSKIDALKKMMATEDFRALESLLLKDVFIWEKVESKIAKGIVLEDIRRGLDAIAVFQNLLTPQDFKFRWGYFPVAGRTKTKQQARGQAKAAREIIETAQRSMK